MTLADRMIRSWPSPVSSASRAERRADSTIASIITSRLSRGSGRAALASISSVSSCWSSHPQFTPMRTGLPLAIATSTIWTKLRVVVLGADVARVDAVLGQRGRGRRVLRQQQVAVVMEVADQRNAHAQPIELLADDGHRLRRLVVVDGDAHQLAAGVRQLRDLDGGGIGVGGVGVRHRLDDDRMSGADEDAADVHAGGRTTLDHVLDATRSAPIGHGGRMLAPIHPAPLPEGAGNVRPLPHPE